MIMVRGGMIRCWEDWNGVDPLCEDCIQRTHMDIVEIIRLTMLIEWSDEVSIILMVLIGNYT